MVCNNDVVTKYVMSVLHSSPYSYSQGKEVLFVTTFHVHTEVVSNLKQAIGNDFSVDVQPIIEIGSMQPNSSSQRDLTNSDYRHIGSEDLIFKKSRSVDLCYGVPDATCTPIIINSF